MGNDLSLMQTFIMLKGITNNDNLLDNELWVSLVEFRKYFTKFMILIALFY